jgi:hypothetical protein
MLEFHALSLMAEVGVAVAGFATIAGVIRPSGLVMADAVCDAAVKRISGLRPKRR